jgi:glucosylceramidase
MKIAWDRRQFLQGAGSALAVGTAMAGAPGAVMAQASPASVRHDEASCITTTAETPWQAQALAAPGWRWDALNLNVDPTATAPTMEGFWRVFQ